MAEKLIRLDDNLFEDILKLADEQSTSANQVVIKALEFYRDYYYMKEKASIINENILGIIDSKNKIAERNINYKTNKVLSELAIQSCIQNQILANSLEVSDRDLNRYRLRALDFLKENNRLFRMDEVEKE